MASRLWTLAATVSGVAAGLLLAGSAVAQDPPARPPPLQHRPPSAPARPPPPAVRAPSAVPASTPQGRPARRVAMPRSKRPVEVVPPIGTPIASSPSFSRFEDGSSRIWVEVSRKVDVMESKPPGRLIYRLRGTSVVQRTNQLPLLMGFFDTPVERAQLAADGPDVELIIELREQVATTYRVVETPRGMVLQLDFPKSVALPGRDDNTPEPIRGRSSTRRTLRSGPQDDVPAPVPADSN